MDYPIYFRTPLQISDIVRDERDVSRMRIHRESDSGSGGCANSSWFQCELMAVSCWMSFDAPSWPDKAISDQSACLNRVCPARFHPTDVRVAKVLLKRGSFAARPSGELQSKAHQLVNKTRARSVCIGPNRTSSLRCPNSMHCCCIAACVSLRRPSATPERRQKAKSAQKTFLICRMWRLSTSGFVEWTSATPFQIKLTFVPSLF
jgi:hypothetical protein